MIDHEICVKVDPLNFPLERHVKEMVKKLLAAYGWWAWMPPANGYGKRNVDFNALKDGRFLAVETKHQWRMPSVHQEQFLVDTVARGGHAAVVNEHNLRAFELWLANDNREPRLQPF